MRYLSVCSGIEAATVAWAPLGWHAAGFSEIEPFPSALLAHYYPDTPNYGDMEGFRDWRPGSNVDVLVGGTPCQSFSVAGLRAGLDDPRGNLALVYLAMAERFRPRWLVWENVPGVLSSDGGRAFGAIVGAMVELGYGVAWRVLNAQHFGVPQRRRRVFVVGHLGGLWQRAAAVLFEPESLRRDPAPRPRSRQENTGTLRAGAGGGCQPGVDEACGNQLVANPLTARMHKGVNTTMDEGQTMVVAAPLTAGGHPNSNAPGRRQEDDENLVACAIGLRSDAARSGEARTPSADAEGRVRLRNAGFNYYDELAPTIDTGAPHSVCAFAQNQREEVRELAAAGALAAEPGMKQQTHVQERSSVRRLTPRECERLQGFPDDYTLIEFRGKPAKDGVRYRALGNSMAVPVMRWIGARMAIVDALP